VRDTGEGIPAEEIGDLFEKYHQGASGKLSPSRGTGLGLVICKKIAEAHGGRIVAESRVGEGSIFAVDLPRTERPLTAYLSPSNRFIRLIARFQSFN
jgi:two-component system, OmpR family, sensor kinase